MNNPRARYRCLADGCGFRWEEPARRKPVVVPDPEKPEKTFSAWPSRAVVCPACKHPYVKWENYAEHDWNAHARLTHSHQSAPAVKAIRGLNRARRVMDEGKTESRRTPTVP
jgi:hypothetical protein